MTTASSQLGRDELLIPLVTRVAEILRARSGEVVDSMSRAIDEAIDDLGDAELRRMLEASIEGNVATILQMLGNDIPLEHVSTPTAANEYAVRLARTDAPGAALRRAYHIGTDDLLAHVFTEIERLDAPAELKLPLLHHISGWLHRYVDWVTREVLELFEAERRALFSRDATHVSQLVQRVVDREPVDHENFARVTGHRLDQHHLAAVLWVDEANPGVDHVERLRDLAAPLARILDLSPPLATPADRSTLWLWFGLGSVDGPDVLAQVGRLETAVADAPGVRVGLGSLEAQVGGFRRSLEQAQAVRLVLSSSSLGGRSVASYDEDSMAAVAMLARDLPMTRRWVSEVLGPLAEDTEDAERLRATVHTFLTTGSYTETSQRLVLHRNTVKYRVAKVERERGRPVQEGRLDLELALHACVVLGSAVLRTPGRSH